MNGTSGTVSGPVIAPSVEGDGRPTGFPYTSAAGPRDSPPWRIAACRRRSRCRPPDTPTAQPESDTHDAQAINIPRRSRRDRIHGRPGRRGPGDSGPGTCRHPRALPGDHRQPERRPGADHPGGELRLRLRRWPRQRRTGRLRAARLGSGQRHDHPPAHRLAVRQERHRDAGPHAPGAPRRRRHGAQHDQRPDQARRDQRRDGVPDHPGCLQQPADLPGRRRAAAADQQRLDDTGFGARVHRVVDQGRRRRPRPEHRARHRERAVRQRCTGWIGDLDMEPAQQHHHPAADRRPVHGQRGGHRRHAHG